MRQNILTRTLIAVVALATSTLLAEAAPPLQPTQASVQYVGAVSIQPSQDAAILASWYDRLGISTQPGGGGYYGMIQTAAGPLYFAVHPRQANAPAKSSGSVSIVFRVSDYTAFVASAAKRGLVPRSTEESEAEGRFAHFFDPDGNEMTIWGK